MTLTIQLLIDWTFSMRLSHLLEQLPNLENYVKTFRSNEQLYTSPIVNTGDQDSTSLQEHPPSNQRSGNHEAGSQLGSVLLTAAGIISSKGSGLSEEPGELTNY